ARKIHDIRYEECLERSSIDIVWSPDYIASIFDRAAENGLSLVKIHIHRIRSMAQWKAVTGATA
ncbi:hypothetical protein ACC794_37640, partial [Rhizobium ruizarguesonis]